MGPIIAERRFTLFDAKRKKKQIVVRVGKPVLVGGKAPLMKGAYRCTLQIVGIGLDKRIYPVLGEDPFVSLQYAINFAGQLLDDRSKELNLENRHRFSPADPNSTWICSWIWRYGHCPAPN
jgi:hypothetical protein